MKPFASLGRVLPGVRSMRRTLLLVSVLLLVAGSAAHARSSAQPVPQGAATFVVTGHGWGHGVGLSQWGAYGYAQKGFDYEKIVLHYFPGTELGAAPGIARASAAHERRQDTHRQLDCGLQGARRKRRRPHALGRGLSADNLR